MRSGAFEDDNSKKDAKPAKGKNEGKGDSADDNFPVGLTPVSLGSAVDDTLAAPSEPKPGDLNAPKIPHNVKKPSSTEPTEAATIDRSNQSLSRDVSIPTDKIDSMANQMAPPQIASSSPSLPSPATVQAAPANRTWQIIFIPMVASLGIFVLLWSVINGWFERLIF